jgi:23S rRNA pseudouridine1911/1915/1917 synthase
MSESWRRVIDESASGQTLAAVVRTGLPGTSWSQSKRMIEARRVTLNREPCQDAARRVKAGDVVVLLGRPAADVRGSPIVVRHLDDHVVVVEKPAGINTVRHPAERDWTQRRRDLDPTLEDLAQKAIAARLGRPLTSLPALRKVHRLDRLTSGLVVFARSATAERELGRQFKAHTVERQYLAVVSGRPEPKSIRSWLVRDRGDGRRGSSGVEGRGKLAVTHLENVEPMADHRSLITIRLETGRTHQIRIHLAEMGCPVIGDPVYGRGGGPRLMLHAAVLGFRHPATDAALRWEMPPPGEMEPSRQQATVRSLTTETKRHGGDGRER